MFDDSDAVLDNDMALTALGGLPDLVCVCQDGTIQWINAAGLHLLNAQKDSEVVGRSFAEFLGPDYSVLGSELYSLLAEENTPVQTKMMDLNGASCDCEFSVLSHLSGPNDRYIIYARNISEFTRIAENLHLREKYLRDLIDNSLSLICECRNGAIRFINQAGLKLLGAQTADDVIGKPIQDLFHHNYQDIFLAEFKEALNEDNYIPLRLKRMDESYVDVDVAFTSMETTSGTSFLAEAHDITEHNRAVGDLRESIESLEARVEERTASLLTEIATRREAEKQLRHLATHDALTGLPNRSLLRDRIDSAVAGAKRHNNITAVMFIDLDGFKSINDQSGHDAGDELLIWVAGLLRECIRATDTAARIGGDEFVVVITDNADQQTIASIAMKIIERLAEPVQIAGRAAKVGASIGISLYPENSDDSEELMQQADAAMYEVKKSGKNSFRFFSEI